MRSGVSRRGRTSREDLTYTGLANHVVKGGIKVKSLQYDLSGTAFSVDDVETVIDSVTGLPYYDGVNCTGSNITNNGNTSDQCNIRRAAPGATAAFRNTQIGLYIQDDWAITRQLELNLGLRYDYETNMLNNDFVTPADRVAALFAPDTRTIGGITAPPGQTYAQSLALGGIDINQYISTGSSRKTFKGALAPRIGASYDLFADRNTVLFGGWGRSYDRTIANNALDELQKNQQPGGEVWLIRNDFEMPYADQSASACDRRSARGTPRSRSAACRRRTSSSGSSAIATRPAASARRARSTRCSAARAGSAICCSATSSARRRPTRCT